MSILHGYGKLPDSIRDIYRCVRADLVRKRCFNESVYVDKGSGAYRDGSMFYMQPNTHGVTGYCKVQSGYSPPASTQCLLNILK